MKRLWTIKQSWGVPVLSMYFDNKMDAKKVRDELKVKYPDLHFFVSRGPDHKLGVSR